MNITLEYLKSTINLFAEQAANTGIKTYDSNGHPAIISGDIYDLMEFIEKHFESLRLIYRFDYQIQSASINESLKYKGEVKQHIKEDYIIPFLHHLAIQKDGLSAEDLHEKYIKGFLTKHAELLTYQDVMLLDTGTTRAVTNIRFAVDSLRKYNLIETRTADNKRSLAPTLLGMLTLILLKIRDQGKLDDDKNIFKDGYVFYDHRVLAWQLPWVLSMSPEKLMTLFDDFIGAIPNFPDADKINKLIKEIYLLLADFIDYDHAKGIMKVRSNFLDLFYRLISSPVYTWDHTPAINALRIGYTSLWKQ